MEIVEHLLDRTSRTFAMTIPYLPEPTRREVMLAYLLLRVTDTLEDATLWPPAKRMTALQEMACLLGSPSCSNALTLSQRWRELPPCQNGDYLELVQSLPVLVDEVEKLEPNAVKIIWRHCQRVAIGMAECVCKTPRNLSDLQQYCYIVAGIVGEMLTELFLLRITPSSEQIAELNALAVPFGEGLQLVNILKDSATDQEEGRQFLPSGVPQADVYALAKHNLEQAFRYCRVLSESGAPKGILMFTQLPVTLAEATIERVRQKGPGTKLTRAEIIAIRQELEATIHTRSHYREHAENVL